MQWLDTLAVCAGILVIAVMTTLLAYWFVCERRELMDRGGAGDG